MTSSTHKAEVVKLEEFHPIEGADRIVRTDVFGGFPAVVAKKDAIPGSYWVYIQPDSLVPVDRPEFEFLGKDPIVSVREDRYVRIKTRKFKGQVSMGLLISAPPGATEGEDLAEHFGIKHYEPPQKGSAYTPPSMSRAERWARIILRRSKRYGEKPAKAHVPYYDIDALRRFPTLLEGKDVIVTEKVHGSNVAYTWEDRGLIFRIFNRKKHRYLRIRSRTVWKSPDLPGWYSDALTPEIEEVVKAGNGQYVLFGEIYGPTVQKGFSYNVTRPTFVAFDLYDSEKQEWVEFDEFRNFVWNIAPVPIVPVLYRGPFNFKYITELSEGPTVLGNEAHVREGVVIQADEPNPPIRQLKCVGQGYYEYDK